MDGLSRELKKRRLRTHPDRVDLERSLQAIARDFLARISKRVDFAWGSVSLLDRKTGLLRSVAARGEEMDFIVAFRFRFGNGLSAWALEHKKTVALRNIHHGRRHRHHPVRSFLTIPIVHENVAIGTVTLAHRNAYAFTEQECRYLDRASRRLARLLFPVLFHELEV